MAFQTNHLTNTLRRALSTALLETRHDDIAAERWSEQLYPSVALNIMALSSAKASSKRCRAYPPPDDADRRYWFDDARFHAAVGRFMHRMTEQNEPWMMPDAVLNAIKEAAEAVGSITDTQITEWARRVSRETAHEVSSLVADMAAEIRISLFPIAHAANPDPERAADFHEMVRQEIYALLTTKR